jgi:hypothetical protein
MAGGAAAAAFFFLAASLGNAEPITNATVAAATKVAYANFLMFMSFLPTLDGT